ncbi:SDR family NAD(P)-dependent oxidoreductase [Streptomyces aurantiogriseus]|uniref:Short-chain dehydrogenase/reductase n=1 Tax=Streptomyces aurantiogriseus TaxID=66870 RepID=A0A918FKP2_9ACTN|nr:SDR family NAD(P)-dependent oxidoreductase [Streptomyces aurantiogriseus]GGR47384.1 putative short-chain dehydrogenase/reductase [Streptomyces aurantiogriseus]
MSNWLKDRVAVVTGGGRGIGAAIASMYAAEGAAVLVNDLGGSGAGEGNDTAPADLLVREITGSGGTAIADYTDISDHEATAAMINRAIEEFGRLDILVNVAGILRDKMIFNLEEKDWDAVIAVHLKGHYNTIKPAAQYWRKQRDENAHNRIINFTSIAGLHGSAGQPNYASAKMGIVGLTYSCANALSRYGVTTNAISPGAASRLVATVPSERLQDDVKDVMHGPEYLGPIATYLASERSAWLNGRVIGARGTEVELYNIPEPIRAVATHELWDLDTLAKQVETHFRGPAKAPLVAPWFTD